MTSACAIRPPSSSSIIPPQHGTCPHSPTSTPRRAYSVSPTSPTRRPLLPHHPPPSHSPHQPTITTADNSTSSCATSPPWRYLPYQPYDGRPHHPQRHAHRRLPRLSRPLPPPYEHTRRRSIRMFFSRAFRRYRCRWAHKLFPHERHRASRPTRRTPTVARQP